MFKSGRNKDGQLVVRTNSGEEINLLEAAKRYGDLIKASA
ncbi:hypothetical protein SAMN04487895_101665 [Paenibacillus sophorae]|uniref:Uncharacterized protein n=1 Tax=Paenibacillus sophorae TaxID=1333845 RepID=A0A1H8GVN0_9BACL|nr:hypothetical protein SAMN04487895_101665 [Paenibacillus sophorae]